MTARASRRLGALSERIVARADDERPTVGEIVDLAGRSGIGLVLLVLALPPIVPSPPGVPVGTVFGAALAFVACQMIAGRNTLSVPGALRRRRVPRATIVAAIDWLARRLGAWEPYLSRRLRPLTGRLARRVAGGAVLAMALVIMLPIPFGNTLPALAVALTALALIVRDGVLMAAAFGAIAGAGAASAWLALAGGEILARWIGA